MSNMFTPIEEQVTFKIDMVKVELPNVKVYDMERFFERVKNLCVEQWVSSKIQDFHYNYSFIDDLVNPTNTTIFIGYQHNAATEGKNLIIRFNPAKLDPNKAFWKGFKGLVMATRFKVNVKELDAAFDFPLKMQDIYISSKTGREKNTFKGSEYFGARHTDGYLKKYDKNKEIEQRELKKTYGNLTRLEVTLKDSISVELPLLASKLPSIDQKYQVNILRSLEGNRGADNINLKAVALCIIHGHIVEGELDARRKKQVKDYIKDNYINFSFDNIIKKTWLQQVERIKSFVFFEEFNNLMQEIKK